MVPRALPWATNLLGFQPAQGRRKGFFRTLSTYLTFLDFEYSTYQKLIFVPSMKRACASAGWSLWRWMVFCISVPTGSAKISI